ncbi:MAG TPA: ABC transporter substrate-binding protein [Candidatus Polarisedimenticolaceae bacterium]|nr:ABC transporter substrate-binding protein [Candidatus Polarisedimenticolaceae bacterium]
MLAAVVLAVVLALAGQAGALDSRSEVRDGGVFRIAYAIGSGIDSLDPALAYTAPAWALLDTTCLRLMSFPDRPAPEAFRLVPEAAVAPPKVTGRSMTYTFTVRKGLRFSDGKPVRATAFARAINRVLAPRMRSPWRTQLSDIAGAADVLAGRAATASGVSAHGNTLTLRFTRPPAAVEVRMAMPYMCAVPPSLPIDPEGRAVIPAAGPFHVVEYRADERIVIRRNRFYGGNRPRHVDGFQVDLRAASPREMVLRIDRNEADWGHQVAGSFYDPSIQPPLWWKHGFNRERLYTQPGFTVRLLVLNASRPLFRDNPDLRRAVNLALDRSALSGGPVATRTDQYLPYAMPGFRDDDVYPLLGADLPRAKALARGNTRSGRAIMYTTDFAPPIQTAMTVRQQLAEIGLDVEVKAIPEHIASAAYAGQLSRPGEPWDIALVLWGPPIPDPYAFLNALLETDFIGGTNLGGFSSSAIDAGLRQAARLTQSRARQRAYGEIDVRLARTEAPFAAIDVLNEVTFVSNRVDPRCVVLRPALDLASVCLK